MYWLSSPTQLNETLLLAGAGFENLKSAQLCSGVDDQKTAVQQQPLSCTDLPGSALEIWQHSLKVVLPASGCSTPPCRLHLSSHGGGSGGAAAPTTTVEINAPDVWWALTSAPAGAEVGNRTRLSNSPLVATVLAGAELRVFGRRR